MEDFTSCLIEFCCELHSLILKCYLIATFFSCSQGTSSAVNYDAGLASIVSKTNVLVVEGYLFELPDTIKTIKKACEEAHSNGALVAITASDVSCIEKHYDDFW